MCSPNVQSGLRQVEIKLSYRIVKDSFIWVEWTIVFRIFIEESLLVGCYGLVKRLLKYSDQHRLQTLVEKKELMKYPLFNDTVTRVYRFKAFIIKSLHVIDIYLPKLNM